MPTSVVTSDSLLAIEIGTINTRAALFDIVEGRYRFLASAQAVTTAGAPFNDVGEGVRRAIDRVEAVTGRQLLRDDDSLIVPMAPDGTGVDHLAVTMSAGPPMSVVVIGLLDDVSVESARHLAATTYTRVLETINLNDRRKQDQRIDSIVRVRPDLVIVAGGTEGGATHSLRRLMEALGLAAYVLPEGMKPRVLYAGNSKMQREARDMLKPITDFHLAANIRPLMELEQLDAAQRTLVQIYRQVRAAKIMGVAELDGWAGGRLLPTAAAFDRIIRFMSKMYDSQKGVLGVDIGASAAHLGAAFDGHLVSGVFSDLGLAVGVERLSQSISLEAVRNSLSLDLPKSFIQDYIQNKAAYPASLPASAEELDLELALARQILKTGIQRLSPRLPQDAKGSAAGLLPWFEPIVASGSVLTQTPTYGHALLTLLDGLQPTGITPIGLDANRLAASLGAAAEVNPMLAVQVLDSDTFVNLGTVISLTGSARLGTPVLRVRVVQDDGEERKLEVKYGSLEVIPVPAGKTANLRLQPLHRFDIGMGSPGRGGRLQVIGGKLGIVIDARGRPLNFHPDPDRRRELAKKWLWTLGS
ncbi:MAG: glutamate mutase L [Anaerolineales bacterium]|nr:glutamate mutase L [Anaerolineales bacterium]